MSSVQIGGFCVLLQSPCGKFKSICRFRNPRNPAFRMYGNRRRKIWRRNTERKRRIWGDRRRRIWRRNTESLRVEFEGIRGEKKERLRYFDSILAPPSLPPSFSSGNKVLFIYLFLTQELVLVWCGKLCTILETTHSWICVRNILLKPFVRSNEDCYQWTMNTHLFSGLSI